MKKREQIEWCDIWVSGARDDARPRALLIGDSITRSYYPHVQKQLSQAYACARVASSKCVSDPIFFKELDLVFCDYSFPIIHFNNGLHGWDYDENAYASGLEAAFDFLLAHCRPSNLIWGSTTPVWQNAAERVLDAKNERVKQRNQIASKIAAERGIHVNDLFSAVIERPELFSADGVHFLESGQLVLGECVAQIVLKAGTERAGK